MFDNQGSHFEYMFGCFSYNCWRN